MILPVCLRLVVIFSFTFPKTSSLTSIDYNHNFDYDYRLNVNALQPFGPHRFLFYPWQSVYNNILPPVSLKSDNGPTQSIAISGRSPLRQRFPMKDNNRRKFNSTTAMNVLLENKVSGKQLSDTDAIALADVFVDLLAALLATGGAAGVSMAALALLSGFDAKKMFTGVQSNVRGFILGDFTTCVASSGDSGFCTSITNCNKKKGIASGTCSSGGVCCTNLLTTCSGTVQYNNTYWQSPSIVNSDSLCVLTVKLDPAVAEQRGPICQLRLDFSKFNIAQPNSEGVCGNDVFTVGGTDFNVPSICGENKGQHMYLNVPAPASDLLLSFKFGAGGLIAGKREWRMQIAMMACADTSLLAPFGCLQYYSSSAGTVDSFNWADTTDTATRQLSNQNYHICFRRELVDTSTDTTLCFTPSLTPNDGKAFSLTGSDASAGVAGQAGQSQANLEDCNNDYLVIPDGYDPSQPDSPTNFRDRYCGERLNVLPMSTTSSVVCTQSRPYRIIYNTNGDETPTDSRDAANIGNLGFSIRYYHITS